MNLDFYKNYIKIIDCGTLSEAARSLHIAQSALSAQVKQFEEEYHTTLFIRNARKMEPTAAGKILYEKAKNIVLLLDATQKEIDACVDGSQGTLRIGMTQAYPDTELSTLLVRFQKENPQIRYEFYETSSGEVIELLRAGVIDIGIVRTSGLLPADLKAAIDFRQHLYACCRYNNPWITPYGKEVMLSSLDRVPLAISRGFEALLRDVFARSDVQPNIMSISTSRSNPMMWARAGAAIAIICTAEAESSDNAEMFFRPLAADNEEITKLLNPTRSFVVAKDRTLSAVAQKLLSFSAQYFRSEN